MKRKNSLSSIGRVVDCFTFPAIIVEETINVASIINHTFFIFLLLLFLSVLTVLLMHEAAIGKIAGEQLLKLETLGLTPEEAEEKILEGFLR